MEIKLPAPTNGSPDLLIIAGEHSGDQHAARLVKELQAENPGIKIAAFGGEALKSTGVQLLFDLAQHSVVGFFEVLKNYGFFKSLFNETVAWICEHQPRNICFVDYPGFNLRLAKRLKEEGLSRKGGGAISTLYYIGPQIWAWKGHRRHEMAETLDALGVIFPFEVDCYKDTELSVDFVGHPFVTVNHELPVRYSPEGPLLLLPGSRMQPVARIFPAMVAGYSEYRKGGGAINAASIYPSEAIREKLQQLTPADVVVDLQPIGEPVAGRAVVTSSGTISLACALAGLPGVIAYRAHPLTYLFAKRMVTINYLGMPNLLLDMPHYPEFIQKDASPDKLALEIKRLTTEAGAASDALKRAETLQGRLQPDTEYTPGKWLLVKMV